MARARAHRREPGAGPARALDAPPRTSLWKLPLPGGSGSTPIVSGGQVFLNVADGPEIALWCVERTTGRVSWKRPLGPSEGHAHRKHNMSTPSPVVGDGRVFAMTGNGVVKGFTVDGKELWARDLQKDYGKFGLQWGYGSSPLLEGGRPLRPGAARLAHAGALVPARPRAGHGEEPLPRGAAHPGHPRVARRLHDARGGAPRREDRDRGDRRRRRHGPRPGDGARAVARVRPQPGRRGELPRGGLAGGGRRCRGRAHAGAPDADPARLRPWGRHRSPTSSGASTGGRTSRPRPPTGSTSTSSPTRASCGASTSRPASPSTGRSAWRSEPTAPHPLLADGKLYLTNEDGLTTVVKAGPAFERLAENPLDGFTVSSARRRSGPDLPEDARGAPLHRPRVALRAPRPSPAAGRPAGAGFRRSS